MPLASISRRRFLATGSALVAATTVPAWAELFQSGPADDALRTEIAEAALARAAALGATYADIRVNRYRRESIATRERQVQNVSRSTSRGFGLRVLVNGAWGFAASNRLEPAAARAVAEQAVAIARANAVLTSRKVILAPADRVVTSWTSAFKRDPFEVPLDAKIAFLMKLNETALAVPGVSFVSSQVLFVDEQKYFRLERRDRASRSAWFGRIRSSAPPLPTAPAATFRRAPSSIAPSSSATNTSRTTRGSATPRRPATKSSRS